MKKKLVIIISIIVVVVLIGIGGTTMINNKKQENKMIEIVNSQEAKEVFEQTLKNLDTKALTNDGLIKTYKINVDSIKHNPMGGINVNLKINNDDNLIINFTLDKLNGKLESGAISYSGELADQLEEHLNE